MTTTDAEVLALIRKIVKKYNAKGSANIPTYVLVDALGVKP